MVALSDLQGLQKNDAQKYLNKYQKDENTVLQAISNIPSSARQFANDLIYPFLNPIQTAKSIKDLSKSVVAYATGDEENDQLARELGNFFVERYGSLENIKKTLATDPVGMLSDASIIFTGGGMLAAKTGKVGKVASDIGKAIDPVNLAAQTVKTGADLSKRANITPISSTIGLTTGAGGTAVREAFEAGVEGGARGDAFKDNLRGKVNAEEVVTDAFENIKKIQSESKQNYLKGIDKLKLDKQTINFEKVRSNIDELIDSKMYQGEFTISANAQKKLQNINKILEKWEKNPKLHNAKGVDMLKKRIDAEYPQGIKVGDEGVLVTQIRDIVKKSIVEQVPDYSKVMKAYEEAVTLEKKLIKELSLGNKTAAGTTLRKLQSVMRNNVNTNFGQRLDYVKMLDDAGADKYLMSQLAGQSLSSFTPRGLQGLTAGGQIGLGTYGAVSGAVDPLSLIPSLAIQSPRLMGESAYAIGKSLGGINRATPYVGAAGKVTRPMGILGQENKALEKRGLL